MTPGAVYELPKPDKRFKPGHIKMVNGKWRGHPDTVVPRQMDVPVADVELRLRPPYVISDALAKHVAEITKVTKEAIA